MRFTPFILILILCGFTYQTEPNEETEIRTFLEQYYKTMSDRNWPKYRSFFSSKATLTTIWQESEDEKPAIFTNTISEFVENTAEGPDSQPIFEEKMTHAEISIRDNLAQAWVKYEAKFGTEENLYTWKGYDLFSLIKFEGQWKIVSVAYASEHE